MTRKAPLTPIDLWTKDPAGYIRKWIADHGLTQREFSEKLPVPLRTVEGWVAGNRTPPDWIRRALRDLSEELNHQ